MLPESLTARRIAAVAASTVIYALFFLLSWLTRTAGKDESWKGIAVIALSIVLSSAIVGRLQTGSLWRLYFSSCIAAILPLILFLAVVAIVYRYDIGGLGFAMLLFAILVFFASLLALPFVALGYFRMRPEAAAAARR
jgi:hypothetical protein